MSVYIPRYSPGTWYSYSACCCRACCCCRECCPCCALAKRCLLPAATARLCSIVAPLTCLCCRPSTGAAGSAGVD